MSRMAQELQRQVEELQKAQRTKRRPKVIDEEPPAGGEGEDVTEAVSAEPPSQESGTEPEQQEVPMAKKKSAKKSTGTKGRSKMNASRKKATARAAKPRKARATSERPTSARHPKQYSLVDGIPETLRNQSAARSILESIKKRGMATANDVRADHPKFPDPTIRFYLGKFQRDKVLTSE